MFQSTFRHNGVIVNNLTITRVTEEDFNKRFMCVLFSTQLLHGQTDIHATLVKYSGTVL